jgi:hypothetical protein
MYSSARWPLAVPGRRWGVAQIPSTSRKIACESGRGGLGEPGQFLARSAAKLPVRPQRAGDPPERSRSRLRAVGHLQARGAAFGGGARPIVPLREVAGAEPNLRISLQRLTVGVCRHARALQVRRRPLRTRCVFPLFVPTESLAYRSPDRGAGRGLADHRRSDPRRYLRRLRTSSRCEATYADRRTMGRWMGSPDCDAGFRMFCGTPKIRTQCAHEMPRRASLLKCLCNFPFLIAL